jgi:hypothetical protein
MAVGSRSFSVNYVQAAQIIHNFLRMFEVPSFSQKALYSVAISK